MRCWRSGANIGGRDRRLAAANSVRLASLPVLNSARYRRSQVDVKQWLVASLGAEWQRLRTSHRQTNKPEIFFSKVRLQGARKYLTYRRGRPTTGATP